MSKPPPISERRPGGSFSAVILPLTLPGIAAGSLLVFIPAVGEFVIPDLLGGPDTLMIGKLLWQEFFDNVDWPAASAVAVALVVVLTAAAPRWRSAFSGARARGMTGRGGTAFASPRWRWASAFSICRSRYWSPIRSMARGW